MSEQLFNLREPYEPSERVLGLSRVLLHMGMEDESRELLHMAEVYERTMNYYELIASGYGTEKE